MISNSKSAAAFALMLSSIAFAEAPPADGLKPLPEVKFSQVTLTEALDFLRDTSGANIEVDWKALQVVGISKDSPVSLRLRNVTLRVALNKTLDSAAPGLADFYTQGNVITVTSHEVADSQMVTRVIPVGDLLMDIPDFTGPTLDLNSTSSAGGGSRGGGKGGQSSGGGTGFTQTDTAADKSKTRDEKATELIEIIQTTIRPDIWDINGGKAKIKYFNGTLIITAPLSVQRLIA